MSQNRAERPSIALVHDYLTQRGGAERVVLALAAAFPGAPVYTSLYDPETTFPQFETLDVRASPLNRLAALRRRHRLALPVLAPSFSVMRVAADVAICSSSGWAHGAHVSGRKIVYCHAPARWLYQADRYLGGFSNPVGVALGALTPPLRRWDRRAAATADRYLVNSNFIRRQVAEIYGIEAEVLHPPIGFDPSGPVDPAPGIDAGFFLCVSRLLAYKNVTEVTEAFRLLPAEQLVVVGTGPLADQLAKSAPPNVTFVGEVDDPRLRWLYLNCRALVAASFEDFGLTPIEAAACGRPTVALRWGGFLDTVVPGRTGLYFDRPDASQIARAVEDMAGVAWTEDVLRAHADAFSAERFSRRIQLVADEELSLSS